MKVPAATQSQDLLRIIEVASKTDITTCFKSLVNTLISQHQFCLKHDGARYGQQRDQLQQELQLATPAVLKWASVLQKFGLQYRELPPQEQLKSLDFFAAEKHLAIEKIQQAFTDQHSNAVLAQQILKNPVAKAIGTVESTLAPSSS